MYLKHNSFSTVQHVVLRKVFNFLIAIPTNQWRIWRHSCRQVQPQVGQTPRRVHTTRPKTLTRHSASQGITTITFVLGCPTIKYRNITSNIRPDFAVEKILELCFWHLARICFYELTNFDRINSEIYHKFQTLKMQLSKPVWTVYIILTNFGSFTKLSKNKS